MVLNVSVHLLRLNQTDQVLCLKRAHFQSTTSK